MTGNVLADDVTVFLAAGADVILSKPLRLQSLLKLIQFVQKNGSTSVNTMTLIEEPKELVWISKPPKQ